MPPHRIGRYTVVGVIGTGAFATVLHARDERLDADVAVKVLAENHSLSPDTRERFVSEGQLLRRVRSPHVVDVHDLSETDEGQPFLVLELASGGDLAARRRSCGDAPVGSADLLTVVRHVAAALGALHGERVVHRDLTPGNLLLAGPAAPVRPPVGCSPQGERVVLADLGLSKDLAAASGLTVGTGTAGFTPPEQGAGGWVDQRADIWSASALLVWLLLGRPPGTDRGWVREVRALGWPAGLAARAAHAACTPTRASGTARRRSGPTQLTVALRPPPPPEPRPDPDAVARSSVRRRLLLAGTALVLVLAALPAAGGAGRSGPLSGAPRSRRSTTGGSGSTPPRATWRRPRGARRRSQRGRPRASRPTSTARRRGSGSHPTAPGTRRADAGGHRQHRGTGRGVPARYRRRRQPRLGRAAVRGAAVRNLGMGETSDATATTDLLTLTRGPGARTRTENTMTTRQLTTRTTAIRATTAAAVLGVALALTACGVLPDRADTDSSAGTTASSAPAGGGSSGSGRRQETTGGERPGAAARSRARRSSAPAPASTWRTPRRDPGPPAARHPVPDPAGRRRGRAALHVTNVGDGPVYETWSTMSDANSYGVSGVALLDLEQDKRYLTLRDSDDVCLCTNFPTTDTEIGPEEKHELYAQFVAPPEDTTSVDVSLPASRR